MTATGKAISHVCHVISMAGKPLGRHVYYQKYLTGWWYTYPSEKYESHMGLLYIIVPNIWKKIQMFQTTNQLMMNSSCEIPRHVPVLWIQYTAFKPTRQPALSLCGKCHVGRAWGSIHDSTVLPIPS